MPKLHRNKRINKTEDEARTGQAPTFNHQQEFDKLTSMSPQESRDTGIKTRKLITLVCSCCGCILYGCHHVTAPTEGLNFLPFVAHRMLRVLAIAQERQNSQFCPIHVHFKESISSEPQPAEGRQHGVTQSKEGGVGLFLYTSQATPSPPKKQVRHNRNRCKMEIFETGTTWNSAPRLAGGDFCVV